MELHDLIGQKVWFCRQYDEATEKWNRRNAKGEAKLKRGNNVLGIAGMTLPMGYTNRIKISSFRLTIQRKYLIRELQIRGEEISDTNQEGINALKKRLTELVKPDKDILLLHPDNKGKYDEIMKPPCE